MANPNAWNVTAEGHKRDIKVAFEDSQVIFTPGDISPATTVSIGLTAIITIQNNGPSDTRV